MVSDLIVVHALWCDPRTDRLLVPTEVSRVHALENRVPPDKIQVVGLPIRLTFMTPPEPKPLVRQRLGLKNKFTILLMGGGQGLGRVYEIAEAIGRSGLDAQLIVIAGRNKKLKEQLDAARWPIELAAYGFIQEVPALMNAADVLITKAGPTTICEAFTRSLPSLSVAVPSQENETPVMPIANRAACWLKSRTHRHSAPVLQPDLLASLSANSTRLARPRAASTPPKPLMKSPSPACCLSRARGGPLLARLIAGS
jgi:1,2-diacylglycerol 3-beta-galactosyltransferase